MGAASDILRCCKDAAGLQSVVVSIVRVRRASLLSLFGFSAEVWWDMVKTHQRVGKIPVCH